MIIPGRAEWIGVAGLGLILSATIAFEIAGPAAEPQVPPAGVMAPLRDAQPGPAQSPDRHGAWLRDVLARPLFSPDRKPVGTGDVRGLPRLTGIIVSETRRLAIFASATGDHPLVREAGARIGAYEVKAIDETGVTVTGPGGTNVIRPLFDSGPAAVKRAPTPRVEPPRALSK
jgi:hypothetical protein